MGSWVYLFSKFTHEALLLESLAFFSLCGAYAFFWIRRKRRLGAVGEEVPSSVVKLYLNQLIVDAEQMRAQLFGLLGAHGMQGLSPSASSTLGSAAGGLSLGQNTGGPSLSMDPMLANQIAQLELKMAEQTKAMQTVIAEKERLEKDLSAAKLTGPTKDKTPAAASGPAELVDKVKTLEAKLAEYSIIEDDLANLKRLQQENAQLRASLASGAPASSASTGTSLPEPELAAVAAEEPVLPTPKPRAPSEVDLASAFEEVISGPETSKAAAPAPVPALVDEFETLVNQVEKSLEPARAEAPAPAETPKLAEKPAPAVTAATMSPVDAEAEKTDADLVAEFEKMLNA
jgi:hypothetical protein